MLARYSSAASDSLASKTAAQSGAVSSGSSRTGAWVGALAAAPTHQDFVNSSSSSIPAAQQQIRAVTVHSSQAQTLAQKPAGESEPRASRVFEDTGSVELGQTVVAGGVAGGQMLATQTAAAGAGGSLGPACQAFGECCAAGCTTCGQVLGGLGQCLVGVVKCCLCLDD